MENSVLFEEFRLMFLLGGLWKSNPTKMFTFYSYSLQFLFIMSMISFGLETITTYSEGTTKFGFNLGALCSMVVSFIKVEISRMPKYQSLVKTIFDTEKYMKNESNQKLKECYTSNRRITTWLIKCYKYIMIFTMGSALLVGIVFIVKHGIYDDCDGNCDRPILLPIWVPFSPKRHYIMANIFCIIVTGVIGSVTLTVDCVILCPLIYIIFRLKNLKYVLRNLETFSKDEKSNFEEAHFSVIIQCLMEHQKIIQEAEICNSSVKYILFFDFLFHSSQIACFAASVIGNDSLLYLENILSFAAFCYVFSQLLLVYWYGHVLIEDSVEISRAIYQSNWYMTGVKSERYLWMMMVRSQESLGLSIGPFGLVNLNKFIQIVKTVYSIITLLIRA